MTCVLCPRSVKSASAGSTVRAWGCWRRASPSSTSATSAATLPVRLAALGARARGRASCCVFHREPPTTPLLPCQLRFASLLKFSSIFHSYGFIFHVSYLGKNITIIHQHNYSLTGRTESWLFPGEKSVPQCTPVTDFQVGSCVASWMGLCSHLMLLRAWLYESFG